MVFTKYSLVIFSRKTSNTIAYTNPEIITLATRGKWSFCNPITKIIMVMVARQILIIDDVHGLKLTFLNRMIIHNATIDNVVRPAIAAPIIPKK